VSRTNLEIDPLVAARYRMPCRYSTHRNVRSGYIEQSADRRERIQREGTRGATCGMMHAVSRAHSAMLP